MVVTLLAPVAGFLLVKYTNLDVELKFLIYIGSLMFSMVLTFSSTIDFAAHLHMVYYGRTLTTYRGEIVAVESRRPYRIFKLKGLDREFSLRPQYFRMPRVCFNGKWLDDLEVGNFVQLSELILYGNRYCIVSLTRYFE